MMTSADLAVALDFYSRPPDGAGTPRRTPAGSRVNLAKYPRPGNPEARAEIGRLAAAFVAQHPLLVHSDVVVAMPGHEAGPARLESIASEMARAIRDAAGMPIAELERTVTLPERKGDRDAAQEDSMRSNGVANRVVIVVDDTVRDGDTIEEACRALREGGAWRVFALTAAKDWTGTRGFRHEDV